MVCPRCGRRSSGKICVWCRSGQNLSEYSIRDYDKYSAEIPEERRSEEKISEQIETEHAGQDEATGISEKDGSSRSKRGNTGINDEDKKDSGYAGRDRDAETAPSVENVRGRSRKKGTLKKESRSSDRNDRKKKKEKDNRIREMQSELQDLRARQKEHERQERDRRRQEKERGRSDEEILAKKPKRRAEPKGEQIAEQKEEKVVETVTEKTTGKFSTLVVVGFSRLLQLASAVLMALLTVISVFSFWQNREGLGAVQTVFEERNYALALYLAVTGAVIFFGMVWTLWIMSRKGAGGEVRMKTYDTGRGFVPFLLCLGAVWIVTRLSGLVPENGEMWHGMAKTVSAVVMAVEQERRHLMIVSMAGAGLSLIRRILRV